MEEIRIHGRGGQGGVIASKVLAVAMFSEGKQVQAFPKFGVERRGAPIEAFLRVDSEKILIRSEIDSPDHVVVLDETLLDVIDVTAGLVEQGWVLINSGMRPEQFVSFKQNRVATVDAGGIAVAHHLGSKNAPIVNTAICGAFARYSGLVAIESVCAAIQEEIPANAENNIEAAREAYEATLFM